VTVRVGFLGAGLIATYHSKSLHVGGADVSWSGVYDPDHARAVFCEKPLAVDLASATQMAATVAAAGVVNQVGLVLRHSPAFGLLKALVADPASGRPMSVVFRDDQFIPIQGGYRSTWRGDVAKAGAGTLLEHSIHDLDMLEHVLGPVAAVSARTSEFHALPGIEDVAAVSLRFANGAVGTLVSVWHDVLERPSLRRIEVFCERTYAALEGDWFGPLEWVTSGSEPRRLEGTELEDEARARGAALGNPDVAFIDAVVAGRPAWPSFTDALRAHAIADAIYRSAAADGASIAVDPL
jgi:predicted dehydrogenase